MRSIGLLSSSTQPSSAERMPILWAPSRIFSMAIRARPAPMAESRYLRPTPISSRRPVVYLRRLTRQASFAQPNGSSLPSRSPETSVRFGRASAKASGLPSTSTMLRHSSVSSGLRSFAMWASSSRVIGTKPQLFSQASLNRVSTVSSSSVMALAFACRAVIFMLADFAAMRRAISNGSATAVLTNECRSRTFPYPACSTSGPR